MTKQKKINLFQIAIAYSPQASKERLHTWQRCKHLHDGWLILLVEDGYYFSMNEDALVINEIAGYPLHSNEVGQTCFLFESELHGVLTAFQRAGLFIAICNPPEDLTNHLFN